MKFLLFVLVALSLLWYIAFKTGYVEGRDSVLYPEAPKSTHPAQ